MLSRKHLPGVREIHLSVICNPAQPPIQPSSSQSGREVVRKKCEKTTNINEVLHGGITTCALPDSICTSLMASAIMRASINIKAGTVAAKGFTSITAVPPFQVHRRGIYMKYGYSVSLLHHMNSCWGDHILHWPQHTGENKNDLNVWRCW